MKKRARKPHICDCPRCRGVKTADPRYGYDRSKVPGVECLHCDQPIGRRAYEPVAMLARQGIMMFAHKRCPKAVGA